MPDIWQSYVGWNAAAGRLLVLRQHPHAYYTVDIGELSLASGQSPATIVQSLTLQPTLHRPTLALTYRQEDPATTLTVQVEAAGGLPELLTQTLPAGAGWQRGWVDLTAFAGRTVTLTISVQGAAGSWPVADFDEILLGSWTTPLVTDVSPPVLEGPGGVVTVTGDNFIGTPMVTIGGLPATVSVVDSQHLSVIVPPALPYGQHALVVANPDGFATTSKLGVQVGQGVLYLPTLMNTIPGGWVSYFP
jgi:hypothetical protein